MVFYLGAVAIGLISGAAVIVVLTLVIAIIAAITCFQTKKARELIAGISRCIGL